MRKHLQVVAAIIYHEGRVFATQRGYGEFKDGWEFPGGKVQPGETPEEALVREIQEELDTRIQLGALVATVEDDYPDFHLSMGCYWCRVISGDLVLREHEAARWLSLEELEEVDWLPADRQLLPLLRQSWPETPGTKRKENSEV
ncbi:MAG: (deoxy)nucleoside triphosphate pyrophosphohydrolase [Clostridia bacterium]|nr:(deoxy)nucleoside triphosphate pyrophosphohydrolase [Clostridia bacterium]